MEVPSSERRPPLSRPEVESLVFGSVIAAALGALLFGWIGAVLLAFVTGTLLRWGQRKRQTLLIPEQLRQTVWLPIAAFEAGAILLGRGEDTFNQRQTAAPAASSPGVLQHPDVTHYEPEGTMQANDPVARGQATEPSMFRTLMTLFLSGYVLQIILWFVPTVEMSFGGFMGEEGALSMFSFVRLRSQQGNVGFTFFAALLFASNIVVIALALALPHRWVFISASSVSAFGILLSLFSGSNDQMTYLLVPLVLAWVAKLLTLLGFFIKPSVPDPRT